MLRDPFTLVPGFARAPSRRGARPPHRLAVLGLIGLMAVGGALWDLTAGTAWAQLNPPIYAGGIVNVQGGTSVTTKLINRGGSAPNTGTPNDLSVFAQGAITTWSITFPNPTFDGQKIIIACPGGSVTTISLASTDGSGIGSGGSNTCTSGAGQSTTYQYSLVYNTWAVINTVGNANLSVSLPTYTLNKGLQVNGNTISGEVAAGNCIDGFVCYAENYITAFDNSDPVTLAGGNTSALLYVHDLGVGSGGKGRRVGIESIVDIYNAGSDGSDYIGGLFYSRGNVNVGGTGGSSSGNIYGLNVLAELDTTATYYTSLQGSEYDIQSYEPVGNRIGISVVDFAGSGDTAGSNIDAAFNIGSETGGVGWGNGLYLGNFNGQFPIASTGNVIGTASGTVNYGTNYSNLTCTTSCFASPGFSVSGVGAIIGSSNVWNIAPIATTSSGTGNFVLSGTFLTPDINASGGVSSFAFGRDFVSNYDAGYLELVYEAQGSSANQIAFAMNGTGAIFSVDGLGNTTAAGSSTALYFHATPVAIASLPTCNSTTVGSFASVNNGVVSPTYHGAVSTTGAATDGVYCYYSGSAYSWVYN